MIPPKSQLLGGLAMITRISFLLGAVLFFQGIAHAQAAPADLAAAQQALKQANIALTQAKCQIGCETSLSDTFRSILTDPKSDNTTACAFFNKSPDNWNITMLAAYFLRLNCYSNCQTQATVQSLN
jgi:hypothetical protein